MLDHPVAVVPEQMFSLDFEGDAFTFRETANLETASRATVRCLGSQSWTTRSIRSSPGCDHTSATSGFRSPYKGEFLRHQSVTRTPEIVIREGARLANVAEVWGSLSHQRLSLRRGTEGRVDPNGTVRIAALDRRRGTDQIPIPQSRCQGEPSMLIYTSGATGPIQARMISGDYICYVRACKTARYRAFLTTTAGRETSSCRSCLSCSRMPAIEPGPEANFRSAHFPVVPLRLTPQRSPSVQLEMSTR